MRSRPAPLIPTEPPIPPTSFAQVGSKLHKLLRGPGLRPSQVVEKPHLRLPRASVENFRLITPEEAVDEGEPRVSREACPLLAALREVLKPQGARLWCPRRLRLVSCQVWSAGPKARRCPRKTKLRLRRRHEHVRYTLNACSSCSARALHFEQRPLSTAVTAQERMEPTRWLIEPHGRVRLLVKFFSEARVGPGRCLKLGTAVCDMLRHVATCCDIAFLSCEEIGAYQASLGFEVVGGQPMPRGEDGALRSSRSSPGIHGNAPVSIEVSGTTAFPGTSAVGAKPGHSEQSGQASAATRGTFSCAA